jgi:hypothetical protein
MVNDNASIQLSKFTMPSESKKSTGITFFRSMRNVVVIFPADSSHTDFFGHGELVWCCHHLQEFLGCGNVRS